ncbi:uncharacterized protein SCHCODRAFT_02671276 [Schizophyllum commune H4-8]|nr:uncharacterized protein SCHCODRAFT_02671276 [Schizophyllum commune H4-8]KAI5888719.1 hypothetical protein SCHCODRAFT_02671276 [Schizophyllum commune H4-8]
MQIKLLTAIVALALAAMAATTAEPHVSLLTEEEMIHWLQTTDAELTFVGEPIPGVNAPEDHALDRRAALNTVVTYCNRRVNDVCGGACTVYNGQAKCLSAPGTNCLAATNNVGFCANRR